MSRRRLKVILEWDPKDKVWISTVPAVGGISTYGDTLASVVQHTREAVVGFLETATELGLAEVKDADLLRSKLQSRTP